MLYLQQHSFCKKSKHQTQCDMYSHWTSRWTSGELMKAVPLQLMLFQAWQRYSPLWPGCRSEMLWFCPELIRSPSLYRLYPLCVTGGLASLLQVRVTELPSFLPSTSPDGLIDSVTFLGASDREKIRMFTNINLDHCQWIKIRRKPSTLHSQNIVFEYFVFINKRNYFCSKAA